MRFQANALFAANITYQNLLDTVLVATGATTGFDLYDSVRVNSVECWSQAILGSASTVVVGFNGATVGSQGDQKVHTDTSMGIEPAHVKARPDPRTQAGQFQPTQGANAFFLDVPSGCVIDVSMTLRQPMVGTTVAAQNALVGATAGALYFRGLDGKAVATTVLPVQGALATI